MKALFALLFTLWPILGYAYGTFILTDTQGIQHEVSMQMMLVEHGQLLPDGTYLTPIGASVTVKGGQILINTKGGPLSNSPVKQTDPANTNSVNTVNQGNPLMNPYQGMPLPAVQQQQSNPNTQMMNVQPGINTIYGPPPNPNTPTMNQVGPTAPSQEPGAPGL